MDQFGDTGLLSVWLLLLLILPKFGFHIENKSIWCLVHFPIQNCGISLVWILDPSLPYEMQYNLIHKTYFKILNLQSYEIQVAHEADIISIVRE